MRIESIGFCALSVVLGCGTELGVSPGAQIRCETDAQCPDGYGCVANACKSLRSNDPPLVAMAEIERSLDGVLVPIVLSDSEGDPVDIEAAIRVTPEGDFSPVTLSGSTALASSPDGTAQMLSWPTASTDLLAVGRAGFAGDIVLRLTPRDAMGPGPAVESPPFDHGNDAPRIGTLIVDDAVVRGNVVVRFDLADSAEDPVGIAELALSYSGTFIDDASPDVVLLPLTDGTGGTFPGGVLQGLRTSVAGVPHNVTWNSRLDGAGYHPSAALRLRVLDDQGALSAAVTSAPFVLDNVDSEPGLTVEAVTDLGAGVSGPVQFNFTIDDAEPDLHRVLVSYSLDYDIWTQAFSDDNLDDLERDVTYSFTWSIAQLPPGVYPQVWVRFEVQDDVVGEIETLGPFAVTVAEGLDTTPPNYVAPVDDTLTHGAVLLRWTSRVGAASYQVQVARFTNPLDPDDDFDSPVYTATTSLPEHLIDPPLADDVTYVWRVRADITTAGQYSSIGGLPAKFHLFLGVLYVHCAATDALCADAAPVGNRSQPFKRLNAAVARAAALGLSTVKVASRGGSAAYPGIVLLQDGVSVLGGYDETFATRDIVSNRTLLSGGVSLLYGAVGLVAEGIAQTTVVEGFSVQAPAGLFSYGMRIIGSTQALTIRACDIVGGEGEQGSTGLDVLSAAPQLDDLYLAGGTTQTGTSLGLSAQGGANVFMINTEIEGQPNPTGSRGVQCQSSALFAQASTITGGVASNIANAVELDDCSLEMLDSTATGGTGGAARGLSASNGSQITLQNSTLQGGTASPLSGNAAAAELIGSGTLSGGTLISGTADPEIGLRLGGAWTVGDATITASASSNSIGVWLPSGGNPVTLHNSAVAASGTGNVTALLVEYGTAIDVHHNRLVASGGVCSTGVTFGSGSTPSAITGTFSHNLVTAGASTSCSPSRVVDLLWPMTLSHNIIGSDAALASVVRFTNNNTQTLSQNVIFGVSSSTCIAETMAASHVIAGNLVSSCGVFYFDVEGTPSQYFDCVNGGNFATSSSGCTTTMATPATGSIAAPRANVFANGFDVADMSTWVLRTGGPADIDGTPGPSLGDPGVNAGLTGPQ